jgi:hypothetical protein
VERCAVVFVIVRGVIAVVILKEGEEDERRGQRIVSAPEEN